MSALQAPEKGEELAPWVTWLVETYELWQRIPPWWANHPACVAELADLCAYHSAVEAFEGKTALENSLVKAGWHDFLGRFLERLRTSPCCDCIDRSQRGIDVSHRRGKASTARAQPAP